MQSLKNMLYGEYNHQKACKTVIVFTELRALSYSSMM